MPNRTSKQPSRLHGCGLWILVYLSVSGLVASAFYQPRDRPTNLTQPPDKHRIVLPPERKTPDLNNLSPTVAPLPRDGKVIVAPPRSDVR